MASVDISALKKLYGDVVALSDITLSIPSGSFYTLLGPSGCGKTTLLRTIAGFHQQTSGSIAIDGAAIEDLPAYRRDVGMVFQDYAIFPHLSVRDNVAFGLKQRKVAAAETRRRIDAVLKVVQLESFADRMPHELSGGQQQRVGLARAIVIEPKVLLMDEPLSNLDAKLRVDLRAELRRIQRDLGITTIYVTHDQEEALAMSDIVCVMYEGVIQQAASPLEIYMSPANRFVASFVGANNFLSPVGDLAQDAGTETPGAVCAIRPEALGVTPGHAATVPGAVTIPAILREISFIGREMEVFGTTSAGDEVKALARPDPAVLALAPGSEITFSATRKDLLFFEGGPNGKRIA